MIRIDHLHIRLPAHLRKEADGFSALLGEALARVPLEREIRMRHITLPIIKVAKTADARMAASQVADQIRRAIQGGDG
ncbi:MAG: hypothetical protein HKP58_18820 [Desulfatitalea sp.]|nr:hypothetical protein [Desulfatitalea sp.]NNK02469.1 hypothetical protein [Desulfatitalea sp.]